MSTYPTDHRSHFIDWCQAHGSVFVENAADIGLTAQDAAAFEIMTDEAAEAIRLQNEAIQAARAATRTAQAKVRQLRAGAGKIVRTIRAYAENEKVPLIVYNLAQIPPPAAPSPAPPPAAPKRLTATLNATVGALTVRWKASHPAGTRGVTYLVRRRLVGAVRPDAGGERATGAARGEFVFVGATGEKAFVDASLPAGVEEVEYTVQAVRGKRSGAISAIFTVRIGTVRAENETGQVKGVARVVGVSATALAPGPRPHAPGARPHVAGFRSHAAGSGPRAFSGGRVRPATGPPVR